MFASFVTTASTFSTRAAATRLASSRRVSDSPPATPSRLRDALLTAARDREANAMERDDYGQRYVLDFEMTTARGQAKVRSSWIVRSGEDVPRLTTCYVL